MHFRSFLFKPAILVILLAAVLGAARPATAQQHRWTLRTVTWDDQGARVSPNRAVRIDNVVANATGGYANITALNDGACQPGAGMPASSVFQRFRFTWSFDQDITQFVVNRRVTVNGTIVGDRQPCLDQDPHMYVKGDANIFGQTPGGWYAKGGHSDAGPQAVFMPLDYGANFVPSANFTIQICCFTGNRNLALIVTYAYAELSPAAPSGDQAAQDMIRRAGRDNRFGAAIAGSLGAMLDWGPMWELRWMDFNFTNGRRVRIFLATNKANRSIRFTVFWDPDTGQWLNWEPAA